MPSVALGHDGDLFFLAVGRVNRAVFGDLEIALALDAGVGWFGDAMANSATTTRLVRLLPRLWRMVGSLLPRLRRMAYSFNVVASIGQWEREIMLERQREGIARAKKLGRYKGRAPTARNKAREIIALTNQGVKPLEIGRRLAVSRASVYRILADNGAAPQQT